MRLRLLSILLLAVMAASETPASTKVPPGAGLPPRNADALAREAAARASAARPLGQGAILLRSASFDPLVSGPPAFARTAEFAASGPTVALVQFLRPLGSEERESLEGADLRFLDAVPRAAYLVEATPEGLERLRLHGAFRWLGPYAPGYKLDPSLSAGEWAGPVFVDIRLFPFEDPARMFRPLLERFQGSQSAGIHGTSEDGLVVRFLVAPGQAGPFARAASENPSVWSVAPWLLPRPLNDDSAWVIQSYDTVNRANYALSATIWNHGITGTGQLPCVNDTGLDADMCYFTYGPGGTANAQSPALPDPGDLDPSKKVAGYAVLPGATAYDGYTFSFHGTHTSGSVAGDDYETPSSPSAHGHDPGDGMAPNAKVFFQDVGEESGGVLAGLANDYALIFQQAYNAGSRVHSDSWGSDTAGAYTSDCLSVDRFLWRHEDFQLFFAAGNAGPWPGSVGSPAAAKNCVTVGALSHGSEGANSVASFSSRGPALDGRIKPDVCAPGVFISSALGDESHSSQNCWTNWMSGTSMATPTAAGGATLLRQYFTDGFYPAGAKSAQDPLVPSGALLKAALVNGAMDTGTSDAPNFNEGWGRIHLDDACFFSTPVRDARRTRVWDKRNASGLNTGETEEFTIQAAAGQPLKVTLCWTDAPGSPVAQETLINNLDLEVSSPSGTLYRGNVFSGGWSAPNGTADAANNLESVFIQSPAAGEWTLRVRASSVPGTPSEPYSGRQGYALVAAYADCLGGPQPPATLLASQGTGGISLSWPASQGAASYQVYRSEGDCSSEPGAFHFIGTAAGTSFTDSLVNGGFTYAYKVRAADSCVEGDASACAPAAYTGNCTLLPAFEGLLTASSDPASPECDVALAWAAAASSCPLATGVSYNIYRGESPYFTADASSRIAAGVAGLSYSDPGLVSGRTYYYLVRAEDATTENGGPANGGNEEMNSLWVHATPFGSSTVPGAWADDGGDTAALLSLEAPWTITDSGNHTPGGALAYHSGPDGWTYPANKCASAATPEIALQSGSPSLSYWARYNIEVEWDGVVIEVSADGGPFSPSVPSAGYPSTFAQTGNPPINACGFPAAQPCFNGPEGNAGMTPWTQYTHDLSAFAGRKVRIRWRFSTDPGAEFEGFTLDDIQITSASLPAACSLPGDNPPAVELASPQPGATLRGTATIAAEASDDHGVTGVEFFVDGASAGTTVAEPWTLSWDTSGLSGEHVLSARATDTAGQTGDSGPVSISADNPKVDSVLKLASPFRLKVLGSGFEEGCTVTLGGLPAPVVQRKSDGKIVVKGGAALKDLLPKGVSVELRVTNPDAGRSNGVEVIR